MKVSRITAFAVAAAFATPLWAQTAPPAATGGTSASPASGSAAFKALDKNQDGFVSREEVSGTAHDANFSSMDKDGDGKISPAEHAAVPSAPAATGSTSAPAAGGSSSAPSAPAASGSSSAPATGAGTSAK